MAQRSRGVVLIIEDDSDTLEFYSAILTNAGFRCVSVANAADALDRAAEVRFDVIVMDLGLPRLEHGLALARRLHGGDAPPMISVTGYSIEDTPHASLFVVQLRKPATPDAIVSAVEAVLRG